MSLQVSVQESFERSFALYQDLVDSLEEGTLIKTLPQLPSNTVGLQLWCVVGARESYSKAIVANEWAGFSCSLERPEEKDSVGESLRSSAEVLSSALREVDGFTEEQNRLLVDLLEHEAAHQGQLIRYLYGLRLEIPKSWKERFNLQ